MNRGYEPPIILGDDDRSQLIGWAMVACIGVGVAIGWIAHAAYCAASAVLA